MTAPRSAPWHQSQIAALVVLPSLIGVLTAGAAILFVQLISAVQWLALGSTDLPPVTIVAVPSST